MKLNIIIPTRDRASKVNDLISSFKRLNKQINCVFIVDDSTKKSQSKQLQQIYKKSKQKIMLINNKKIAKLKSKVNIKLGNKKWNLGSARTVGVLYSLALSNGSTHTMFFDDDMVIEKNKAKQVKIINKNFLGRIDLFGSPDLSRLEWLELYLKVKDPSKRSENDYIEEIYKRIRRKSRFLLDNYTNLNGSSKAQLNKAKIPQRRELSGGAFICSNDVISTNFFPNWSDSDWYWFNSTRKSNILKNSPSGMNVTHNGLRKDIININNLKFEERGKILTRVLKGLKRNKEDSPKIKLKLSQEIFKRKKIISEIIESFEHLKNKEEKDKEIITKIKQLRKYVDNINEKDCEKKLKNFLKQSKYLKNNLGGIIRSIKRENEVY